MILMTCNRKYSREKKNKEKSIREQTDSIRGNVMQVNFGLVSKLTKHNTLS